VDENQSDFGANSRQILTCDTAALLCHQQVSITSVASKYHINMNNMLRKCFNTQMALRHYIVAATESDYIISSNNIKTNNPRKKRQNIWQNNGQLTAFAV